MALWYCLLISSFFVIVLDEPPKLKHDEPGLLSMALADRDVCGSVFNIMFKANQNFDKLFHFHIYVFLLVHGDVAYECLYLIDLDLWLINEVHFGILPIQSI